MSNYTEIKQDALIKAAILGSDYLDTIDISNRVSRKWKKIFTTVPADIQSETIYLNRFQLGADPEFGLTTAAGDILHAKGLHLNTGEAFGADLNGRIAELRCASSKSALKVVASTLATLRWFKIYITSQGFGSVLINSYPMHHRDGLGGHVHFGRRRTMLRPKEIIALDRLAKILTEEQPIFDIASLRQRREITGYGKYHHQNADAVRLQTHGYEYRTLPTWLGSPWIAMFVLTLSKIFVARPYIAELLPKRNLQKEHIIRLLSVFALQDTDARICRMAYDIHGWPGHFGDASVNWGLTNISVNPLEEIPQYFPSVISGTSEDVSDLTRYLLHRDMFPTKEISPSWSPTSIPKEYILLSKLHGGTAGVKQLGEILQGLVTLQGNPTRIGVTNDTHLTVSCNSKYYKLRKKFREYLPQEIRIRESEASGINISHGLRDVNRWTPILRKFLTSGILDIWHVTKMPKISVPNKKIRSEIIFDSASSTNGG